ncbi:MAG: ECF-type sigma factor [Planctomycetota bacterium]
MSQGDFPINENDPGYFAHLIGSARKGDKVAKDELFTLVYDKMRRIAALSRGVGKQGDTMQPTVMVHEAYLHFEKYFPLPPEEKHEDRALFFQMAALAMRTILKDYWRKKKAKKRGGGETPLSLQSSIPDRESDGVFDVVDIMALDEAMDRLEKRNRRWFSVVLHKYYAGRTTQEAAHLLGISAETVKNDWKLARAWLLRELETKGRQ